MKTIKDFLRGMYFIENNEQVMISSAGSIHKKGLSKEFTSLFNQDGDHEFNKNCIFSISFHSDFMYIDVLYFEEIVGVVKLSYEHFLIIFKSKMRQFQLNKLI